jgi:hypothetical protein
MASAAVKTVLVRRRLSAGEGCGHVYPILIGGGGFAASGFLAP